MQQFYTYVLIRPDGTPFYVGKGCGRRYRRGRWNAHAKRVADKILAEGGTIGLCLIPAETEEASFTKEIELIALYGRIDLGTGTLCNFTNGGEGPSGMLHSEETRMKIRDSLKGRTSPRKGCPGHIPSLETRQKISLALKGRPPKCRKPLGSHKPGTRGRGPDKMPRKPGTGLGSVRKFLASLKDFP